MQKWTIRERTSGIRKKRPKKIKVTIRCRKKDLEWKEKVLSRDGYICQNCGERDNCIAHHKIEFNDIIKKNKIQTWEDALRCKTLWDLDNGITLCETCHIKLHLTKNKNAK